MNLKNDSLISIFIMLLSSIFSVSSVESLVNNNDVVPSQKQVWDIPSLFYNPFSESDDILFNNNSSEEIYENEQEATEQQDNYKDESDNFTTNNAISDDSPVISGFGQTGYSENDVLEEKQDKGDYLTEVIEGKKLNQFGSDNSQVRSDFDKTDYMRNDILEEKQDRGDYLTEVIEGKKLNVNSKFNEDNKTIIPGKQKTSNETVNEDRETVKEINKQKTSNETVNEDRETVKEIEKRNFYNKSEPNKAVILMFDRGYKSQYDNAKPILDKYNFKASFFIVCDYVDEEHGMSWNEIKVLKKEGHDIQSHGVGHSDLTKLSQKGIEKEIKESKKCLSDRGLEPKIFEAPFNKGADDPKIVNTISKYFEFGVNEHSELMFLKCDGYERYGFDKESYEDQKDCRTFDKNGKLTNTNKYSIREWSHDRFHDKLNEESSGNPHGKQIQNSLFDKFVKVVNSQEKYNKKDQDKENSQATLSSINAIPVIDYHEINKASSVSTPPELFEKEMKYLHDNDFLVLTFDDLEYDHEKQRFYIKL